jgi:hypothetical protein
VPTPATRRPRRFAATQDPSATLAGSTMVSASGPFAVRARSARRGAQARPCPASGAWRSTPGVTQQCADRTRPRVPAGRGGRRHRSRHRAGPFAVCRAPLRTCAGHGSPAGLTVTARAGSGHQLLLAVRWAQFRLPSSGCPGVRATPRPARTCAAAIAAALRRWRRSRRRARRGSQRAAAVQHKWTTRSPHDGQNQDLHRYLRRFGCYLVGRARASARTAARGFANVRMD